jgi:structural maintenance of chromosomes protein 6
MGYAGVILKVELTNFMCHSNLVLELNPRVNFVVGKNGSGKSAIMTGLMVVLGTRAADTSRGRSLSSFVRMGCAQAKIRITLSNSGIYAFRQDKYGSKIILTRIINGIILNQFSFLLILIIIIFSSWCKQAHRRLSSWWHWCVHSK